MIKKLNIYNTEYNIGNCTVGSHSVHMFLQCAVKCTYINIIHVGLHIYSVLQVRGAGVPV